MKTFLLCLHNIRGQLIRQKYIVGFIALILSGVGIFTFLAYDSACKEQKIESALRQAQTIIAAAESAREFAAHQFVRNLFRSDMHTVDDVLYTVPLIAAMKVAQNKAAELGYKFKVPKESPRNPDNEPDAYERTILARLQSEGRSDLWEVDPETKTLRVFRAIYLTEDCLRCHGDPAQSLALWGNSEGRDITGAKMENWKVGELHGAFEIVIPLDSTDRSTDKSLAYSIIGAMSVAFVLIIGVLIGSTRKSFPTH